MQFLSIGVNECAEDVKQHTTNELLQLKNKKVDYTINEVNSNGATSIICSVSDDKEMDEKSAQP